MISTHQLRHRPPRGTPRRSARPPPRPPPSDRHVSCPREVLISDVQALLGHRRLTTTVTYMTVDMDDLRRIVALLEERS